MESTPPATAPIAAFWTTVLSDFSAISVPISVPIVTPTAEIGSRIHIILGDDHD